MNCPRCSSKTLNEKERDGVTIDQCPECRGVWLDRGELERILARTQAEFDEVGRGRGAVATRRRDDDDDDDDDDDRLHRPQPGQQAHHPPRKRGFLHTLGELFD